MLGSLVFIVTTCMLNAEIAPLPAVERAEESKGVALIARSLLFGNADRSSPKLSPDGQFMAWLADLDGVQNIWIAPAGDLAAARAITKDVGRGIRYYSWAYDNAHVLYGQDRNGDENWHVYVANVDGSDARDLTPFDGAQASIQELSHRHPSEVLLSVNDRDPRYHDIYHVDLRTGERRKIFENPGYSEVLTDMDLRVRLGQRIRDDHGYDIDLIGGKGESSVLLTIPVEDNMSTTMVGITAQDSLLLLDSRDRDLTALIEMPLDGSPAKVLSAGREADIGDMLIHPQDGRVQAIARTLRRKQWQTIDDGVAADVKTLTTSVRGDWQVLSRTLDDKVWLIAEVVSDGPARFLRYERDQSRLVPLFANRPALEGLKLAPMHDVVITARDGLPLVSYLTLPVDSDPEHAARPKGPLPLVLYVHGGPWWRDSWGFSSTHQWLANRGYAVLSVNFRGSTGFGKKFLNAGNREWGGKMHDDLLDAVDWAISMRIADPKRIAILGASYGGYAALFGMTFTPDRFTCGISVVGPSDLTTFMKNVPPYWHSFLPLLKDRVGDHESDEGRLFLKARSPITKAGNIARPLLIGQGANDPRVVKSESDQIVAAMKEKQLPVTYVLYPDEGHGFARPQNKISFNTVVEAFLAQHLGGRREPMGEDSRGTSMQILEGADLIPEIERLKD
jgi:dipeptidyl aminopeptidase/acylaminoacyl peptidase